MNYSTISTNLLLLHQEKGPTPLTPLTPKNGTETQENGGAV